VARTTSPLLDRNNRLWCLAAAFACSLALLRLIPSWLAAALLIAELGCVTITWRKAAPTLVRVLLTFGIVGLVLSAYHFRQGRDTASAMLLALLMIKPIELRNVRDARSLVGFGLFALFAAFLLDQGPLTLAFALPAAALAYAALARLADAEIGIPTAGTDWKNVLAVLGLFALAMPLTLAAFWLFPRLGSPLWGVPDAAQAKVGISDRMSPGDWVDVLSDDSPAFRVRFYGPVPPKEDLYWRGLVMWNFDGRTWTQPDWPRVFAPAKFASNARPLRYEITLEPTDRPWLFALDLPRAAPDGATLSEDLTLYAGRPIANLQAYEVSSAVPSQFESDLEPGIRDVALDLPAGYDPRTRALAQKWRGEVGDDDAAIVRRALTMYRAQFSYSLAAPPLGRNSVDEFLFDTKIGYCEHFSSSFTFLMRAAGIPARVVTGYAGGDLNPIGDYWLVRNSNAHAWSEVWLRGRGWVRVDPTAAVSPERVFLRSTGATGGPGGGALGEFYNVSDWMRHAWNDFVLGFNAMRQKSLLEGFGLHDADSGTLIAMFATVSGILLTLLVLLQLRDRGPRKDPLLRAWARFTARLARARLRKLPHEPALSWSRRVAALLPAQREEVLSLSRRFVDSRYARVGLDDPDRRELIRGLRAFRVRTGKTA
jgi:transglutaminase-like putative cysteine protease